MDIRIRNEIMVNYNYIINAVIRRNKPLLRALRMDIDDAYQELAAAMLNAIDMYDSERSDSIAAHISAKLQYEILNMKRRHKPCGITGTGGQRVSVVSIECYYDDGESLEIPVEDDISAVDMHDVFDILSSSERETVNRRMDGYRLRKNNERESFSSACEKILEMMS